MTAWRSRPLEPPYPAVFDVVYVKSCDEAMVRSKAVCLAVAVLPAGSRDMLGIWIEQTEGAKFWMKSTSHRHKHRVSHRLRSASHRQAPRFAPTTIRVAPTE